VGGRPGCVERHLDPRAARRRLRGDRPVRREPARDRAPASLAVVGFGVWLVADSDAWDFGQTWIVAALVLVAAAVLVGAAFLSRAALGAQSAIEAGDTVTAVANLRRWSWGVRVLVALLVVATWDMVMKPGL